jgi:hypothetical protein
MRFVVFYFSIYLNCFCGYVLTAWCEWFSTQCTLVLDGCLWTAKTFEECMEQQVSATDGIHNISHIWGDTPCLFTIFISMVTITRGPLLPAKNIDIFEGFYVTIVGLYYFNLVCYFFKAFLGGWREREYTHARAHTRVPAVKVHILGFNSRADVESKTSYTHGSNSQWSRSYVFLKHSKLIRKERGALCIYWDMLLNVQLHILRSSLKEVVRSVLHLLGYIL